MCAKAYQLSGGDAGQFSYNILEKNNESCSLGVTALSLIKKKGGTLYTKSGPVLQKQPVKLAVSFYFTEQY